MATTTYNYISSDNLFSIASKYKTDIQTIARLNPWLIDPVDGHTNINPNNVIIHQTKQIDNSSDYILFESRPKENSIKFKVIYNNDLIEYYFDDNHSIMLDSTTSNKIDSKLRIRFNDVDYDNQYIQFANGSEVSKIEFSYTPSEYKPYLVLPLLGNGSSNIEDYYNSIEDNIGLNLSLINNNIVYNSSNPKLSQKHSNVQLDSYTMDYVESMRHGYGSQFSAKDVDFESVEIGEVIRNAVDSASLNIQKFTSSNKTFNGLDITGSKSSIGRFDSVRDRELGKKYDNGKHYSFIGNASYGKCKVIIGTTTLLMPCFPENITDGVTANYNDETPVGRSEPYLVYQSTGSRDIPFRFTMHREMTENEADIENIVKYIESAVYPNYSGGVAAVKTSVEIGNQIYISGVMTTQSTEWSGPIDENGKYKMVTVSFTVRESTGNPKSHSQIRSMGGFRK